MLRSAAFLLALACGPALAQSVALQGMLGSKALLIVDGKPPKTVAPGETHEGVKVISTFGDNAVVEYGGKRHTLRVGDAPSSVGASGPAAGRGDKIVMTADGGGHFVVSGAVNGKAVQFLVDTGASAVSMGAGQAERLGINYRSGQPIRINTANGVAQGWALRLASVRVGDVELFDIQGVVSEQPMPYVLLGNSFLSRFQMRRDNTQMVLERRF